MTEQKRETELDRLEEALNRALHQVVEGRARDILYMQDELRLSRDLQDGVIVKLDPEAPDLTADLEETATAAYRLLGITRPAGLRFAA